MKILTPAGELPFTQFVFPDGQRHFELQAQEKDFTDCTIETAIRDSNELFDVLLAHDTLRMSGYRVSLNVRYLLGARMDRRTSKEQPNTLEVVARVLNTCGFWKVRILDPHSAVSTQLLNATSVLPVDVLNKILATFNPLTSRIICPDVGAIDRVHRLMRNHPEYTVVQGFKHRDSQTGKLSGFSIQDPSIVRGYDCLIVDDLCDGGGTFSGLADVLIANRAQRIGLFVTHGIFSKGGVLKSINKIYTTDSYEDKEHMPPEVVVFPVEMGLWSGDL